MDEKIEFSKRLLQAIEDAGCSVSPTIVEREFNTSIIWVFHRASMLCVSIPIS